MKKFECLACGKIFETEDKITMKAEFVGQGVFQCSMQDCDVKALGALGFNAKRIDNDSDT